MMKRMAVIVIGIAVGLGTARAQVTELALRGGRVARLKNKAGTAKDMAVVKFVKDAALHVPPVPSCDAGGESWLRLRTSAGDTGEIALSCGNWTNRTNGSVYKDRDGVAGGVQKVVLKSAKMIMKLKGANYQAITGPVDFIEASLTVGTTRYCGRFESANFKRNDAEQIKAKGPSTLCDPLPTPMPLATPTPENALCPGGSQCLSLNVQSGPAGAIGATVDDGMSTWFQITNLAAVAGMVVDNATNGQFGPGPLVVAKGATPDASGKVGLSLLSTAYTGADIMDTAVGFGDERTLCFKIEPDLSATGWIDCDGGSAADVGLSVDSNGALAASAPVLSTGVGSDAGAGGGNLPVVITFTTVPGLGQACNSADYSQGQAIQTVLTTATAMASVLSVRQNAEDPTNFPAADTSITVGAQPIDCANWAPGQLLSVVAPLALLDFDAPVLPGLFDVAALLRLQLLTAAPPTGNETPTATATPIPPSATATATATPAPATATSTASATATSAPATATATVAAGTATATTVPTATATVTATATFVPTATQTGTATPTNTWTPTQTYTPTYTPTPLGPIVRNVAIVNNTNDFGPSHQTFGNCDKQGKSLGTIVSQTSNAFTTKFQETAATDCEVVLTGGGGITASLNTSYTINFDVACPAGAPYELTVQTSVNGAFTINRDNYDGCDAPFFGHTGDSTASVSLITGSQAGGSSLLGSLNLSSPGSLISRTDNNQAFAGSNSATITGLGTGGPDPHALTFTWNASCSSTGNAWDTGAECAVRLGIPSDVAPNGISSCMDADDYPGVGSRDNNLDGHFVTLTGSCGPAPTPTVTNTRTFTSTPTVTSTPTITLTPTQTITPGGPTLTYTPTVTSTPTQTATPTQTPTFTRTPLGTLNFSIVTGPGGSDLSPGCPSEPSNGSLLRTHGNPTGGIPGTICNGTLGDFYSVGGAKLQLVGGIPDVNGVADVTIAAPVVFGASIPNVGGDACWRFEQDTGAGFVDCDGGSAADVSLVINSNGSSAPPLPASGPYVLTGSDAGAGAAVVLAQAKRMRVGGTCPGPNDAAWNTPDSQGSVVLVTGSATSRIDNPRRCSGNTFGTQCPGSNPYQVVLTGANFSCGNWTENSGGKLAVPFHNLDEPIGSGFGNGDIAQVLRLQD